LDVVMHNKKKRNASTDASVGSKIVRRLKDFSDALEESTDIPERFTCRSIRLNLKPQPYGPELVKETRALLGASQAIFAEFLGISTSTLQDWEQGLKSPKKIACRLMDEIRCNPEYWLARLRELAEPIEA